MTQKAKIIVGHSSHPAAEDINNLSPLSNPYFITDESQRDNNITQYSVWFHERITYSPSMKAEICRLMSQLKKHKLLILGCNCAPKKCHGDIIKNFLEANLSNPEYT